MLYLNTRDFYMKPKITSCVHIGLPINSKVPTLEAIMDEAQELEQSYAAPMNKDLNING